jgi:dipeptidyl aminopeptidase/acylaminoacyl peptidase
MNRKLLLLIIPILIIGLFLFQPPKQIETKSLLSTPTPDPAVSLYIESLKNRNYPASDIKIEETLTPGVNYQRYIASYQSDGLKIYGLLTVPNSSKPQNGFPSIVFLHGYLDPKTYQTTARYVAYQDGFARNGFITFKPDLRGHGKSEGEPVNSHFSQGYVIDTLNLISAIKIYKDANPKSIGLWGHSNGGEITLKSLEVSSDIKAAVIWAGVVGSYEDMLVTYRAKIPWMNSGHQPSGTPVDNFDSPDNLIQKYGQPNLQSSFWSKIDPYSFIRDITTPIQLHHGTADTNVTIELSRHLNEVLKNAGKTVELYEYPGGDHNLASPDFSPAMERSITFFKKYLPR